MKRLKEILHTIRSWPEEGKTALAFFILAIAALAIYSLWNSYLSSELSRSYRRNQTTAAESAPNGKETDPVSAKGPASGIISLLGNAADDLTQTFKKIIWRK